MPVPDLLNGRFTHFELGAKYRIRIREWTSAYGYGLFSAFTDISDGRGTAYGPPATPSSNETEAAAQYGLNVSINLQVGALPPMPNANSPAMLSLRWTNPTTLDADYGGDSENNLEWHVYVGQTRRFNRTSGG